MSLSQIPNEEQISYQQAFQRLEKIIEQLNGQNVELEQGLALFEEANALIHLCQKKLEYVEKRVEMVVKGRDGEPDIVDGVAKAVPFTQSGL